ncbi:DUF1800 domain-containing protein [Acidimangrovimonas pyrenivorans]|uniref:DUF1800 family protein n=1 Tax=Acidimangrovimonas pyrenivorans TaxID=2030798 RepID=A0ABV7ANV2_9RHOB
MIRQSTIAAIRFGYGLSPTQPAPQGAEDILQALAGPDVAAGQYPVGGTRTWFALARGYREASKAARANEAGGKEAQDRARNDMVQSYRSGMVAQLQRAVQSADGFRERLQAFWVDHFTVTAKRGFDLTAPNAFAEDAIRPHLTGSFAQMLRAATTHPAMLAYLDQSHSIGPDSRAAKRRKVGLNENLGRELLELHTVGVSSAYTQHDVRQMAKLLTGLGFNYRTGFVFHPAWAEPGAELVLGKRYGGEEPARLKDIYAALDDIAVKPATAQHIAHKLAVHFVSDTPDPALVAHVADAFQRSQGDLPTVYAALLEHPAAWTPQFTKARQPWDYIAAALRALGTPPDQLAGLSTKKIGFTLLGPMRLMGQRFQRPSGPNGWPEDAAAWITPQGLASRIHWAMTVRRVHGAALPDPRSFVHTALADAADDTLLTAARRAESRREGVGLILASATFNRR